MHSGAGMNNHATIYMDDLIMHRLLYIGSSAAYVIVMFTSRSRIRSWEKNLETVRKRTSCASRMLCILYTSYNYNSVLLVIACVSAMSVTVFTRLSASAFIFFNRLKGGRCLFEGGAYSRAAFKYWAK